MAHFHTSRLIARGWTHDDAQAAFEIYGRDEVARWLGAHPRRPVSSLAQMRERLDAWIQRSSEEPDYGVWAIELRTGPGAGTVVGAVLLPPLPGGDGHVEIGWHLNPEHWGERLRHRGRSRRGRLGVRAEPSRAGASPDGWDNSPHAAPRPGHRPGRSGQHKVSGGLPPPRHDASWPDRHVLRTCAGAVRASPAAPGLAASGREFQLPLAGLFA